MTIFLRLDVLIFERMIQVASTAILLKIFVCHIQDLRVYPDALQTHCGYNESVSKRSFPTAFGFLYRQKKDMMVQLDQVRGSFVQAPP
jgi:hypothetical protein